MNNPCSNKTVRKIIKEHSNNRCYYCGINLPKRFHIDHFFPKNRKHWLDSELMMNPVYANGNAPHGLTDINDFRNLVASCHRCNLWKHSSTVSEFKKQIENIINGLKKHSQFNMAVDYNMVHITMEPVVFYFESDEMKDKHKERMK